MVDCITNDISLEHYYKIVVPLFGAAKAAPNKGTTIFSDLGFKSHCWILL